MTLRTNASELAKHAISGRKLYNRMNVSLLSASPCRLAQFAGALNHFTNFVYALISQ
jgi:hypothetical protein